MAGKLAKKKKSEKIHDNASYIWYVILLNEDDMVGETLYPNLDDAREAAEEFGDNAPEGNEYSIHGVERDAALAGKVRTKIEWD